MPQSPQNARVIIRYADGAIFDGAWHDAPPWDIQTVAYVTPNGIATLVHGRDYFQLARDGSIIAVDEITVGRYALNKGATPDTMTRYQLALWAAANGFKVGLFIGKIEWEKLYQLGKKDRDSLR